MGRSAHFAVVLSLVFAGCFVSFDNSGTEFRCSDGVTCPDGLVCIANVCRDPGYVPDAAPDGPPLSPTALIGDLATYSFDALTDIGDLVIDGSGNHRHGDRSFALAPGKFGQAGVFDSLATGTDRLQIPTQAELFTGSTLTIEMWVNRNVAGVEMALFGDAGLAGTLPLTYELQIGADDNLAFSTNSGCASGATTTTGPNSAVATAEWVHVALTWDGADAVFYIDGVATDTVALALEPCSAQTARWRVGARGDGTARFDGSIDEVKISSYSKTAAEIAASMNFDTAGINEQCGSGVLLAPQRCQPGSLCCDSACAPLADGEPCAEGSSDVCSAGVCAVGGGRVGAGLEVLYLFDEGVGATVGDSSGVVPAIDLTIADPLLITWNASSLTISEAVAITSVTPPARVIDALRAAEQLTVEAWVTPADVAQDGPARIVTLSADTSDRNFTLGQRASSFVGRVRSTSSDGNGKPAAFATGLSALALTHIAVTVDASADRKLYVNGVLVGVTAGGATMTNWNDTYLLAIGNEVVGDRLFVGDFHLVAIYDRALSHAEVAQNFSAGPD